MFFKITFYSLQWPWIVCLHTDICTGNQQWYLLKIYWWFADYFEKYLPKRTIRRVAKCHSFVTWLPIFRRFSEKITNLMQWNFTKTRIHMFYTKIVHIELDLSLRLIDTSSPVSPTPCFLATWPTNIFAVIWFPWPLLWKNLSYVFIIILTTCNSTWLLWLAIFWHSKNVHIFSFTKSGSESEILPILTDP